MNHYLTGFIIIWLLLGAIGIWREYHGTLRWWYERHGESYWDFHRRHGNSAIQMLLLFSPLFIMSGPIGLVLFEITNRGRNCWWFTTKNRPNRSNKN
jgi:hypothetical protein